MIEAVCHCGAVRLEAVEAPEQVTSCNCSICRRLGALWAYYAPEQVTNRSPGATAAYEWGDRMIAFHHCRTCGGATHYETTGRARSRVVAINARMMDPSVLAGARVRRFDGADTWTELPDD